MVSKFYQLFFELTNQDAWVLGEIRREDIEPADNWRFSRPPKIPSDSSMWNVQGKPYKTKVKRGQERDYTQAGFAGVPVASFKVAKLLSEIPEVAMFPVEIEQFDQREPWYILHFWDVVDCFDEARSQFRIIQPDDPIRPDLAGNYASVSKTRIDPSKVEHQQAFRIARLEGTIVVSEEVKRRFEGAGVTGAIFESVSGDQ